MKTKTNLIIVILFTISFSVFSQSKTKIMKELKDFALIPEGKVRVEKNTLDVQTFYISIFEVSNKQYREFLYSLKKNNDIEKLKIAQIDSTQWAKVGPNNFNQPMVDYYSNHKAYNEYPVVNISHEGALLYCEWLAEKYNAINKDKSIEYKFTLPTKLQWIRAARGSSTFEYSWMKMGKNREGIQGNFKLLNYENIHLNPVTLKYEIVETELSTARNNDITAPVNSYWPNEFGIYNMSGNVAEMLFEKGFAIGGSYKDSGYDVRVESIQSYQGAAPFIGFRPIMTVINK